MICITSKHDLPEEKFLHENATTQQDDRQLLNF
jgi:hypothetical protein